ncbi:MAG TPA: CHASE4 domain-containing protein, partial [Polyangiaceae bacterium]
MLASRFWYVVLGLLIGLATFLLFLATSMYNRAGALAMGQALSSDSQVVNWYLSNDSRVRSAQLIQFGVDSDVAKSLAKSSENDIKVPDESREKALAALKKVNAGIPPEQAFDAVFAVDQHGRVVAHLGYEQASGNADFELGGYPVVADALRGYIRDDTLVLDRIYRVVARPVELDTSQLPAGAIVGARILDDRFARELSSRTGAAIAFYTAGQRVSSGAPESFPISQLDQIVSDFA